MNRVVRKQKPIGNSTTDEGNNTMFVQCEQV